MIEGWRKLSRGKEIKISLSTNLTLFFVCFGLLLVLFSCSPQCFFNTLKGRQPTNQPTNQPTEWKIWNPLFIWNQTDGTPAKQKHEKIRSKVDSAMLYCVWGLVYVSRVGYERCGGKTWQRLAKEIEESKLYFKFFFI